MVVVVVVVVVVEVEVVVVVVVLRITSLLFVHLCMITLRFTCVRFCLREIMIQDLLLQARHHQHC